MQSPAVRRGFLLPIQLKSEKREHRNNHKQTGDCSKVDNTFKLGTLLETEKRGRAVPFLPKHRQSGTRIPLG